MTVEKYITAQQLSEICSKLPPSTRFYANVLGNLIIEDKEGRYLGYVNLLAAKRFCESRTGFSADDILILI